MFTFPVMLAVEGPLDFVKDCTAVLFISTLDDTDEPKDLKEIIILPKVRLGEHEIKNIQKKHERLEKEAHDGYQQLETHDDFKLTRHELDYLKVNEDKFKLLTDRKIPRGY